MKKFIKNIELWLSGAGLLVVWLIASLAPGSTDIWQVAAITALAVSVLHGAIFWVVRRRQRQIREKSIAEIKEMLADVVKNQLTVIGMWLPSGPEADKFAMEFEGINDSIDHITELVDGISEESLKAWKVHYREAVANATELELA